MNAESCFLCPKSESYIGVFSATGTKWRLADQLERFCEVKLERTVCPRAYLCRSCFRKISNLVEKCKQLVVNSQAIRKITAGSKRVRGVAFAQSPGTGATPHGKVRRHRPVVHEGESVGVIAVCRRSLGVLIQRRRSCPVEDSSIARVAMSQAFLLLEFSYPRTNVKLHVVKLAKRRSSRACLRERRWSVVRLASFYTHARRHTQVHQSQSHTHAHANTHTHTPHTHNTHTHAHAHTHRHTRARAHTHTHTRHTCLRKRQ